MFEVVVGSESQICDVFSADAADLQFSMEPDNNCIFWAILQLGVFLVSVVDGNRTLSFLNVLSVGMLCCEMLCKLALSCQ